MSEAFQILGTPRFGGILVVSDHASNRVPADIDLGIDPALLEQHIAVDIGVAGVATQMAQRPGIAAFLGGVSRLVCDFNRNEHGPTVCPIASDGHAIPGNALDHAGHEARLARFYRPYHEGLASLLDAMPPALILSLHSFTPRLATSDAARPWEVGVLYNEDDRAARIAIPMLAAEGLNVGDNLPYSGRDLNYTMNRHAEGEGRAYLGIEIRQDLAQSPEDHARWAGLLANIAQRVASALA